MPKSDRWIRKIAREHDMINPFSEKQVREGVISYGLSSYGYDLRVADEFKIFTNVNTHSSIPSISTKNRSSRFPPIFASFRPIRSLSPARSIFQDSSRHPDHLRRREHLRPLRHHRQRHAIRARVGRLRHARDLEHDAAAGAHLCQRRPVPDSLLPVRRSLRDQLCRP